jgi:hypothetical protein
MERVERPGSYRIDGRQWPGRADRQWRPVRAGGVAAGLLLALRLLVEEVGSPRMLIETLPDLGEPWADPVTSVLALMALVAEVLAGSLLLVLTLRLLGTLPGPMGGLARRVIVATTPAVVRRLADVLVGGTLLVQITLAAPDALLAPSPNGAYQGMATSAIGPSGPRATAGDLAPFDLGAAALRCSTPSREPVEARPIHRRSAAPLPPWLRGGPSKPAPGHRSDPGEHVVAAGDTLWDIAAGHLMPAERSAGTIHRYWQQVYQANRSAVGADPDLIHPGTRLDVVPFRRDR